jgi:hypothetical protein
MKRAFLAFILAGALSAQSYPQQQAQQPLEQAAGPLLSPQQLENLVAPVALFPDQLLGQVLAASTYPLEIVEAQQWMQQNASLRGQQLADAARQQNWDPSVQAMVAFPDAMALLTRDIRWTTDLGNAFLAQQADVTSAIQRMRARAQQNGRLQSSPQQNVSVGYDNGQSAIQIQPANPEVVYVPSYNPDYVWGPPAYGYYPPLWYPPVSYGYGFGPGIYLGGLYSGFLGFGGWGWGLNWFGGGVFLNGGFFNHYGYGGYGRFGGFGGRSWWAHNPGHRLGIAYPNRSVAGRFGSPSRMDAARDGFRNFGNRGVENRNSGFQNRAGGFENRNAGFENRNGGGFNNRAGGFENRNNGFANHVPNNSGSANRGFNGAPAAGRSFSAPQSNGFQNSNRGSQGGFSGGSRFSAPAAPRSFGNGGGGPQFSAPATSRSFGNGGGGSHFAAPAAPRSFGNGGGGSHFSAPSAPRSFSGGGGGGSTHFSAPHVSSGGGGGHSNGGNAGGGGRHR